MVDRTGRVALHLDRLQLRFFVAARAIGVQTHFVTASTSEEIDAAFATHARERPDARFVPSDAFFTSRRVQITTLAALDRIPAAYAANFR